jgi:hypothetical protein
MTPEPVSPASSSSDSLVARALALEQREQCWSMTKVGVLIGCLGGLIGGFSTVRGLFFSGQHSRTSRLLPIAA